MKNKLIIAAVCVQIIGCASLKYPGWERVSIEQSVHKKPCEIKYQESCDDDDDCNEWFKKRATIYGANTIVEEGNIASYFYCGAGIPPYLDPKHTVAEAEKRNAPLIITSFISSNPNSAMGVDTQISFLSVSHSPIKYATFTAVPYNAVQDRVASEIGNKVSANLEGTGPYYHGKTYNLYWENVWFNSTIVCAAIESVEIKFIDGAIKTYSGNNLNNVFANKRLMKDCPKALEKEK